MWIALLVWGGGRKEIKAKCMLGLIVPLVTLLYEKNKSSLFIIKKKKYADLDLCFLYLNNYNTLSQLEFVITILGKIAIWDFIQTPQIANISLNLNFIFKCKLPSFLNLVFHKYEARDNLDSFVDIYVFFWCNGQKECWHKSQFVKSVIQKAFRKRVLHVKTKKILITDFTANVTCRCCHLVKTQKNNWRIVYIVGGGGYELCRDCLCSFCDFVCHWSQ